MSYVVFLTTLVHERRSSYGQNHLQRGSSYDIYIIYPLDVTFVSFRRMIESIGPTNTRRYTVAVYFRGERLATGMGHSIQHAEMTAATNALNERSGKT